MNRSSRNGMSAFWVLLYVPLSLLACSPDAPVVDTADTAVSNGLTESDRLILASAKIGLPPPGVAASDLPDPDSDGARSLVQYCASCHELPSPSLHAATDWPRVVRRMWMRMEHLRPHFSGSTEVVVPVPQAAERVQMIRYLLNNSLQVSANIPDLPGRDLFENTCAQCHALPDPRTHSSDDWVAVINRMMENMDNMLGSPLNRSDRTRVTLYLQRASA